MSRQIAQINAILTQRRAAKKSRITPLSAN